MSKKHLRTISTKNLQYFKATKTLIGTMEKDYGFTYLMDNRLIVESHKTGVTKMFFLVEETDHDFVFTDQVTHGVPSDLVFKLHLVKSFK